MVKKRTYFPMEEAPLSRELNVVIVDTSTDLRRFLASLRAIEMDPVPLFIEFKGINVGRKGTLLIISIYVRSEKTIYLIDIHTLGAEAFRIQDSTGATLKSIFECTVLRKAVFDLRNGADILYSQYDVSMGGVEDIQLMEWATREGPRKYVKMLSTCVQDDSFLSIEDKARWKFNDESGKELFWPERSSEMSHKRLKWDTLPAEIKDHCADSVMVLPGLFNVYATRPEQKGSFWSPNLRAAINTRLSYTKEKGFDVYCRSNVYGP
ncbi:hypothetical protein MGYG_04941 [Nannizzia gypsea CBS 118893]|uniref:3'-5' exonuclease domain-containing protein n=1 Tax=Arthroderma gypseum (strain ATCC MYA-4604 / CBS 118893) TaxID=535722 RepID=E4UXP5_ARTGP|nr:hypothetical protein MGYG_04941 [Nannizzia gypsea CBS 118893]EFR01940.1 hypothetical protein MGYG_04941 [Nannizzia gypsea CBS 118893]